MRVVVCFACCALLVACADGTDATSSPEVPLGEFGQARSDLTAGIFGADIDPDATVATVDGHAITAVDVATWLDLFPTLTVEQAVADLVDLQVASAEADVEQIYGWDIRRLDAERAGRAIAWARLYAYPLAQDPADAQVDEAVADPRYIAFFGVPELARASHVLLAPGEDATEADRADARARLEVLRDELLAAGDIDAHDLGAARVDLAEEFEGRPISAVADLHLRFPRQYSGEPTWEGLTAVVSPFATAAFENPPGSLVGPIETEFGYHLVLVEGRDPADLPEPDAYREAVRDWFLRNARYEAYEAQVATLRASAEVFFDRENSELLWSDVETRVTAEQERHADEITGN